MIKMFETDQFLRGIARMRSIKSAFPRLARLHETLIVCCNRKALAVSLVIAAIARTKLSQLQRRECDFQAA